MILKNEKHKYIHTFVIFLIVLIMTLYVGNRNVVFLHQTFQAIGFVIALRIFAIVMSKKAKIEYFTFWGLAYGVIGVLGIMYVTSFETAKDFVPVVTDKLLKYNLSIKLVKSTTLLISVIYIQKKMNQHRHFFLLALSGILLIFAINSDNLFPECYSEALGLTQFYIESKFLIIIVFAIAAIAFTIFGRSLGKKLYRYIIMAMGLMFFSDLFMPEYVSENPRITILTNIASLASYYFFYKAVYKHVIRDPELEIIENLEKTRLELEEKEELLASSEEHLIDMIEIWEDAILIYHDDQVVFYNQELCNLLEMDEIQEDEEENSLGELIKELLNNDVEEAFNKKFGIARDETSNTSLEMKIMSFKGNELDISLVFTPILFKNKIANCIMIRNTTTIKKELRRASIFQKKQMEQQIPMPEYILLEKIYEPFFVVSGDFFHFHRTEEHSFIGLIGDITGKGIAAALSNSAISVLFKDAIEAFKDPFDILDYMNRELAYYMENDYVAACCFELDFKTNKATIISAGINEFIYKEKSGEVKKYVNRGPFLGMFDISSFDKKIIDFKPGDRFYFYTDGLEELFGNEVFLKESTRIKSIADQMDFVRQAIYTNLVKRKDDSTCIALEIKDTIKLKQIEEEM